MTELTIKTNHQPRDLIDAYELTESERAEFNYLDWPAIERGESWPEFFRYQGQLYDLGEFETTDRYQLAREGWLAGWDGIQPDSYFSGILVRWPRQGLHDLDTDRIIVGRYYC